MNILGSLILGYLLGSLSPAALFGKLKKEDLRHQGTGNLGATNAMLILGKGYGAAVMLFDIIKAYVAVKLAERLFPAFALAGLLSGSAAVVGHVYPFYMKFKGGKGLAAYGGMVLGVDPLLFLILLIIALTFMFIVNYSVAVPMSAGVLFPILYALRGAQIAGTVIATAVSVLIICKHFSNIGKARRGEDNKIREYVKENLFH